MDESGVRVPAGPLKMKIVILGPDAWGTTLGIILSNKNKELFKVRPLKIFTTPDLIGVQLW